MRVPLSWLREYAEVPADATGRGVADRLVGAGLEVEGVEALAAHIAGSLLVGEVVSYDEEEHANGK